MTNKNKSSQSNVFAMQIKNFDKSKETIKNQKQVINHSRIVRPEVERNRIIEETMQGKRIGNLLEIGDGDREAFLLHGGIQTLIKNEADAETLALSLAQINYGVKLGLFRDLACGLTTAYTNKGYSFYHKKTLIDMETQRPDCTIFTLSHEALWKLIFGVLVDENGRAITGAGDIVKEGKKRIMPILTGQEVEPSAIATINFPDNSNNPNLVIEGKPILVRKWTKNAVQLQVEHCFFPISSKGLIKGSYINQVAGLSSFLAYGLSLRHKDNQKKLLTRTEGARRLILTIQAAYGFKWFSPAIAKDNGFGRVSIALQRKSIKDLCPTAANKYNDRINWKYFSNFVASVGRIYDKALEVTGIKSELTEDVLIPPTERGAEFPERYKDVVYVKMIKGGKPKN